MRAPVRATGQSYAVIFLSGSKWQDPARNQVANEAPRSFRFFVGAIEAGPRWPMTKTARVRETYRYQRFQNLAAKTNSKTQLTECGRTTL
jgi:hypothetical protein